MSYTPTNWQTGDTVTAEKLNKMEQGIELANDPFVVTLTPTAQDFSGTMDKTPAEIDEAIRQLRKVFFDISSLGGVVEATQFLHDQSTGFFMAYANLTFDPGTGTALIQIGSDPNASTYHTSIFPLTSMS